MTTFEPRGAVAIRAAVLEVFRDLAPGEWIERGDLAHRVSERVGLELDGSSVEAATWSAREVLAKNAEVGVDWYMGGYRRLTAAGQVDAVTKRLAKARRGVKRTARWAGAALANPEVQGAERHRMEAVRAAQVSLAALEERRALKRRPE